MCVRWEWKIRHEHCICCGGWCTKWTEYSPVNTRMFVASSLRIDLYTSLPNDICTIVLFAVTLPLLSAIIGKRNIELLGEPACASIHRPNSKHSTDEWQSKQPNAGADGKRETPRKQKDEEEQIHLPTVAHTHTCVHTLQFNLKWLERRLAVGSAQ